VVDHKVQDHEESLAEEKQAYLEDLGSSLFVVSLEVLFVGEGQIKLRAEQRTLRFLLASQ
jgi:hypothetical protein